MYSFADFSLDINSRKLFHKNEVISISARAYEILLLLIKNQGEVVSKETLLQEIWADSFVEESNLAVHISALRRILGEKRGERKFIDTVSGRGYCFVKPVKVVKRFNSKIVIDNGSEPAILNESKEFKLAILPFNFQNKEDEYLADGITESLIERLSNLPNLRITAFSAVKKYRNTKLDLQEIGFQLGVGIILVGEIIDTLEKLSVRIEMVKSSDMSHLWSIRSEEETKDIFQLKKKIFVEVAEKLQISSTSTKYSQIQDTERIDFDTHKLFLKGKYILDTTFLVTKSKESLFQAIDIFQQVLHQAPHFAAVYVATANCYLYLNNYFYLSSKEAIPKAKTYLQLALSLDPNNSDAYCLLGEIKVIIERNWYEAQELLLKSLALNPNNLNTYNWLGILSIILGRFDDAEKFYQRSLELNPISLGNLMGLCRVYYYNGDFENALSYAQEALDLDPNFYSPILFSAMIMAEKGEIEDAEGYIEKAISAKETLESLTNLGYIFCKKGELNQAWKILEKILNTSEQFIIDNYELGVLYSALQDFDNAFRYFEKGLESNSINLCLIKIDPRIKNLRSDKRYISLIQKLNLN